MLWTFKSMLVSGVFRRMHYNKLIGDTTMFISLTTLTVAAAIGAAVIAAPLAGADTGTDYGDTNATLVCSVLADYPSFGGLTGIAQAIHEGDGLSYYQAGEAIAEAVYTTCPQFTPLVQAFAHAGTTQA